MGLLPDPWGENAFSVFLPGWALVLLWMSPAWRCSRSVCSPVRRTTGGGFENRKRRFCRIFSGSEPQADCCPASPESGSMEGYPLGGGLQAKAPCTAGYRAVGGAIFSRSFNESGRFLGGCRSESDSRRSAEFVGMRLPNPTITNGSRG